MAEAYCELPMRSRDGVVHSWTLVSLVDYEFASQWSWSNCKEDLYARRFFRVNGKGQHVKLHRELVPAPKGMVVDHINRNRLDNRRENLRVVTDRQNRHNRSDNTSGEPCVSWDKNRQKWVVIVGHQGRCFNLGRFSSKIDAVSARDALLQKLEGESS